MLASLAAKTITIGGAHAFTAFVLAAVVFVSLLIIAAVGVSVASSTALTPIRMTGHSVRRWSGYVLVAVGLWFVVLAALADPLLV